MLIDKISLDDNEKILKQTRRHWFVLFSKLLSTIMSAVLPIVLIIFFPIITSGTVDIDLSPYAYIITYVYSIWLLFIWIGLFSIWTEYYLDVFVLTDKRVILFNQKGFFRRNVASFRLERLQDMNIEINGALATLLDFGSLTVETAGAHDEEFRATNLPNPRELKSMVMSASDNRIKFNNGSSVSDGL